MGHIQYVAEGSRHIAAVGKDGAVVEGGVTRFRAVNDITAERIVHIIVRLLEVKTEINRPVEPFEKSALDLDNTDDFGDYELVGGIGTANRQRTLCASGHEAAVITRAVRELDLVGL